MLLVAVPVVLATDVPNSPTLQLSNQFDPLDFYPYDVSSSNTYPLAAPNTYSVTPLAGTLTISGASSPMGFARDTQSQAVSLNFSASIGRVSGTGPFRFGKQTTQRWMFRSALDRERLAVESQLDRRSIRSDEGHAGVLAPHICLHAKPVAATRYPGSPFGFQRYLCLLRGRTGSFRSLSHSTLVVGRRISRIPGLLGRRFALCRTALGFDMDLRKHGGGARARLVVSDPASASMLRLGHCRLS